MTEDNTSQPTQSSNPNLTKSGVDTKKANLSLIITGIIILVIIIALVTNGFGLFKKGKSETATSLTIGVAPVMGSESAPVTIYEFSDFSCPYCAATAGYNPTTSSQLLSKDPAWQAPIPRIIEEYVKTGKARLVFKYAQGHGTGQPAHLVAWCLNDQNLFWQFHDKAFANQEDVSSLEKMKTLAESVGANITQLESCVDARKYNYLFEADNSQASSNSVSGTPTFFINNKRVEGAASFSVFERIIEQELAKVE